MFHTLRHTFGTHAALFGVNPWRLQAWLGHKRIDETMHYVARGGSAPARRTVTAAAGYYERAITFARSRSEQAAYERKLALLGAK